jgi:LmbE family N-acetylglucosaminyl deacetylase
VSAAAPVALIIAPHLDDAALSVSNRLQRGGVLVATVFAGVPHAEAPLGAWDRLTGATSSRERQLERLAEDDAAMQLAGARAVRLDELDEQYRDGRAVDVGMLASRLDTLIDGVSEVWLPAGIGHDDHLAAREAGVAAARRAGHREVVLYADFPHVVPYGWPAWVTGNPAEPYLNIDAWFSDEMRRRGLDPEHLSPEVVRLGTEGAEFKRRLIESYPSQLPALFLDAGHLERDPSLLGFEVLWHLDLRA